MAESNITKELLKERDVYKNLSETYADEIDKLKTRIESKTTYCVWLNEESKKLEKDYHRLYEDWKQSYRIKVKWSIAFYGLIVLGLQVWAFNMLTR